MSEKNVKKVEFEQKPENTKESEAQTPTPQGGVAINPKQIYALTGEAILAIVFELKNKIPIAHTGTVSNVERILATAQPITIQTEEQSTSEENTDEQPKK